MYLFRLILMSFLIFIVVAGWWLVPSIAPFGVSHYLRIKTPLSLKVSVVGEGLTLIPNMYTPTIQFPLILLGSFSLIFLIRRRELLIPTYVFALVGLFLVYSQGIRILPTIGALLITSVSMCASVCKSKPAHRAVFTVMLVLFIGLYLPTYLPTYHSLLKPDMTYLVSDEYKVSEWLASHVEPGAKVYVMYGDRFRGSQWVNAFAPNVEQVIGCFVEGCIIKDYLKLDYLIKDTLDYASTSEMLEKLCVKYVVVDAYWYNVQKPNNVVRILTDKGFLEPVDEVNKYLEYALVFKVVNESVSCKSANIYSVNNLQCYITPAKNVEYCCLLHH